jgi:glycosyltransferase involved in cell wall biosynthesis
MLLTMAIPAFDEVANLGPAVDEARAAAARVAPGDAEILVVDDGSRDGTGAVADALASRFPDVRVVRHETNRGFSGAMTTCFREARGDWIFLAPADGQTPMAEVIGFFEQISGSDIVVGVRATARTELKRRVLSRGFHLLARRLFSLPEREFSSAFLFRGSLLRAMRFRARPRSAALLPEVLFRARRRGARISVREIEQRARWSGRAKGGQLSVALLTLAELLRVALLARIDERWRALAAARRSSAEALR